MDNPPDATQEVPHQYSHTDDKGREQSPVEEDVVDEEESPHDDAARGQRDSHQRSTTSSSASSLPESQGLGQEREGSQEEQEQEGGTDASINAKLSDDEERIVIADRSPPRSLSLLVNTDEVSANSSSSNSISGSEPPSTSSSSSTNSQGEFMNSPFLHFTHALREERSRSKLCLAVGNCINEISQIEETFGKQILKVCVHLCQDELSVNWLYGFLLVSFVCDCTQFNS